LPGLTVFRVKECLQYGQAMAIKSSFPASERSG
jgi:hypothetical protein